MKEQDFLQDNIDELKELEELLDDGDKVPVEQSKINFHFRGKGGYKNCHWRLLDDRIIYHKKILFGKEEEIEYMLRDIKFHKYSPITPSVQFFIGRDTVITLVAENDCAELRTAVEYIKENCGINKYKKALSKIEWKMRCNVCGHVFCYNYADLEKNERFAKSAKIHSRNAVLEALAGTQIGMYESIKLENSAIGKITDYSRCPHCNSSDLTDITNDDSATCGKSNCESSPQSAVNFSSADEIKKFKDLLDIGIITQEEFDAKKKQLLGL